VLKQLSQNSFSHGKTRKARKLNWQGRWLAAWPVIFGFGSPGEHPIAGRAGPFDYRLMDARLREHDWKIQCFPCLFVAIS